MRWPEARELIERIRRERPELTVDDHPLSRLIQGGYRLQVYCCVKVNEEEDPILNFRIIPESKADIYRVEDWEEYVRRHPQPWCALEDSYHENAMGQETDHTGRVLRVRGDEGRGR
jgi:hypothetical protein